MIERQKELQRQILAEHEAQKQYKERRRAPGRNTRRSTAKAEGRQKGGQNPSTNAFRVRFVEMKKDANEDSISALHEAVPNTWQHIKPRSKPESGMQDMNSSTTSELKAPPRMRSGTFIRLVSQDPEKSACPRCGIKGHFASECPSMGGPLREHQFEIPSAPQKRGPVRVINRNGTSWQLDKAAHQVGWQVSNGSKEKNMMAADKRNSDRRTEQDMQTLWQPNVEESEGSLGKKSAGTVDALWQTSDPAPTKPSRHAEEASLHEPDTTVTGKKTARKARRVEKDEGNDYKPRRRSRFDEDEEDIYEAPRSSKASKKAKKQQRKEQQRQEKAQKKRDQSDLIPIHLPDFISVSNLASALHVRAEEFIQTMEDLGFEDVGHDHILSAENAGLVAMEYGYEPIMTSGTEEDGDLRPAPPPVDPASLPTRPPVVTIMGHVDHGKTTILDYLRSSSIAAGEFGGITQHIGAFSVPLSSGKSITFLDTPGHAAFECMRKRGADVTDIVVLVVAADDSVKPQTIEAIKHAQAAGVPIIVAISKVDKEEADSERVKSDLARHSVVVEEYGGDIQVVEVSGKTGQGMPDLEEAISTLSEILDHRAETDGAVEGWVLEATTKKAGRVATVLVKRGTLRTGDILVAGTTWARVRSLRNEAGKTITEAGPGIPVEVDGWKDQAEAGDMVLQAQNEQKASDAVAVRLEKEANIKLAKDTEAINEARRLEQEKRQMEAAASASTTAPSDVEQTPAEDTTDTLSKQTIPFIIKADVSGSAEAVTNALFCLGNDLINTNILRSGVGNVSEFDIEHAAAASGHIAAFNLTLEPRLRQMAEHMGVTVVEDNVIYRLSDKVRNLLEEKLPPITVQRVVGEAEIAMKFSIGVGGRKKIEIAGCKVRNGVVTRNARVRVIRDGDTVYDGEYSSVRYVLVDLLTKLTGTVTSLKNVKKDVPEMRKGTECGMGFEEWQEFDAGDLIQCYEERSEKRTM